MIDMSPETVATVLTLLIILSLVEMVAAARWFWHWGHTDTDPSRSYRE